LKGQCQECVDGGCWECGRRPCEHCVRGHCESACKAAECKRCVDGYCKGCDPINEECCSNGTTGQCYDTLLQGCCNGQIYEKAVINPHQPEIELSIARSILSDTKKELTLIPTLQQSRMTRNSWVLESTLLLLDLGAVVLRRKN
jgi:hypothetical protein